MEFDSSYDFKTMPFASDVDQLNSHISTQFQNPCGVQKYVKDLAFALTLKLLIFIFSHLRCYRTLYHDWWTVYFISRKDEKKQNFGTE